MSRIFKASLLLTVVLALSLAALGSGHLHH